MTIKDLFFKPLDRSINGVVKADQSDDATVWQELEEYVVTNELGKHFRDFFESYSTDLKDPSIPNRVGIWISGFFGSGKSHFLKALSYLMENREAHDGQGNTRQAVEFFDEHKLRDAMIRADVQKAASTPAGVILFNIDSKASSNDSGNPILNVFLRVFNEHQGFSGDHPHIAHMERHLEQKGVYQAFKDAFREATGSEWEEERDGYQFYQDDIEGAIAKALNLSAEAAHKWFEESEETFSVSVENFCRWVKEYLDSQGPENRMIFMVDEVGQFIGSDTKLMLTLQTITENLGTICNGQAWIVVSSQADMEAILGDLTSSKANDFSKIAGRFKTRLSRDIFNALGPDTEKELFEFYQNHLNDWLANLKSYKSKTDVGRFPGKPVIENSILTIERLLANRESYDFFKAVIERKDDLLDLEEDYRDVHEFFTKQIHSWQQLQTGLAHFEKNRQALEKEDAARKAVAEMKRIAEADAPYDQLHKVASLVETVETANNRILDEKRSHASDRVDKKIAQLQAEIVKSGIATPDLSNRLLRPLQLIKEELAVETGIAQIFML